MTNRQFNFSLFVGITIAALGAAMLSKASIGVSLMALGAAIATLALLTRFTSERSGKMTPSPMRARNFQESASDY